MVHAQLNDEKVCNGHCNLNKIESNENLVYLPEGWNEDFYWRKWDNGWSTEKYEPPTPEPDPTISDEIASLKSQNAMIIFALVSNDIV